MKGAVTLRRHHNSQRVPAPIFSIHLCYVAEQDSDASAIRRNRDASTQTTYFVANAFSIAAVTSGESGVTFGSNRATICPSRPIKNLVKFH